ncbi:Putative lumazine-binding [Belliella buryatensis]|uniref:Putative lumazine-binding n=1 Tax=Belliella buryatensis TaxID=1500549 RepID=A0A239AU02_9BACT|nr:nuclear transport factor 2 family protein [Belliella buryatensis]SNR98821.1 Putative lumazine-binding [Belliella buryatensis]
MKKLILFAFFCSSFFIEKANCQTNEINAIEQTIKLYFEGMIERDRSKLDSAFDPSARLIGYRGEQFTITPYEEWASGTAKGNHRNPAEYDNHIIGIEIKGYTALAKTELFWPGIYYFDYLTLIKINEQWKIVHKTWYEEKTNPNL